MLENKEASGFHICCATDDHYAQHCGVMLCSLFEHNAGETFVIHILISDLSGRNIKKLQNLIEYYSATCCIHRVNAEELKGVKYRERHPLTEAAYYRILMASILPISVSKVLYLDSDIVVAGSLLPILSLTMDGVGIAAVRDVEPLCEEHRVQLNFSKEDHYFCSGFMLINLDYWRKYHVQEKLLDFAKQERKVFYHDQDALNAVFRGEWMRLAPKWNRFNLVTLRKDHFLSKQEKTDYYKHPVIIHYCVPKPWYDVRCVKYRSLYYKYLGKTEWCDFKPQKLRKGYQRVFELYFKYYVYLPLHQYKLSFLFQPFIWLRKIL